MPWPGAPKWLRDAAKREGWIDSEGTVASFKGVLVDKYGVELELISPDPVLIHARGKALPAPGFETSGAPVSLDETPTPTLQAISQLCVRLERKPEDED